MEAYQEEMDQVFDLGSRICFWHDLWCGDMVLNDAYPTFYNIAVNKEAAVANYFELHTGRFH